MNPLLQKLRLSQKRYITKEIVSVRVVEADQGYLTNARRSNEEHTVPILVVIVEEYVVSLVRMWSTVQESYQSKVSHI